MSKRGFTLVELLIVVLIIGILAAIGIPQFAKAIEKARGGVARSGLGHIQTAEKLYFAEYEVYVALNDLSDINLDSAQGWTFTITPNTPATAGYTATATRSGSGSYSGDTITMDQDGTIGGNWPYI